MRYLTPFLAACLLAGGLHAADSQERPRQYVGDSSVAARLARLGKAYSTPCNCTEGTPLKGTDGMVFNCACGTMQCVVAASRKGDGVPRLVCR